MAPTAPASVVARGTRRLREREPAACGVALRPLDASQALLPRHRVETVARVPGPFRPAGSFFTTLHRPRLRIGGDHLAAVLLEQRNAQSGPHGGVLFLVQGTGLQCAPTERKPRFGHRAGVTRGPELRRRTSSGSSDFSPTMNLAPVRSRSGFQRGRRTIAYLPDPGRSQSSTQACFAVSGGGERASSSTTAGVQA